MLAIFAHPDDETFRCGGTLALLARKGAQVHVLCATGGEAGVPQLDPEEAGELRQTELECACRALGLQPPRFLDYQDGALAQVDAKEAVARIASVIRELQPQVLLTWPPDGVSGHPDHIAVSRWTGEALDRMAGAVADPKRPARDPSPDTAALYHIVVPHSLAQALGMTQLHTVPDESVTLTVDVSEVWGAKMAAIHCHRTQLKGTPVLGAPEAKQRLFLGVEHFRLARGQSHPLSWLGQDFSEREEDDKT
jgi:LmbE family N-acetylglucosaminyl deacetylase